jgi:hypothetical protein
MSGISALLEHWSMCHITYQLHWLMRMARWTWSATWLLKSSIRSRCSGGRMAVGHATIPAWWIWDVAWGPCHPHTPGHPPLIHHPVWYPRPRMSCSLSIGPWPLPVPVTLPVAPLFSHCQCSRSVLCVRPPASPVPPKSPLQCSRWETPPSGLPCCCGFAVPWWHPSWSPPGGSLEAANYQV